MPNQDLDNDTSEIQIIVDKYARLLDEVKEPLTINEGWILISVLPTNKFYDLQWQIHSKIETIELNDAVSIAEYTKLIEACPNEEIKSNLIAGFENWLEENN